MKIIFEHIDMLSGKHERSKNNYIKLRVNQPDRDIGFVTGAYSDGVVVNGFLFVDGQASVDFKKSKIVLGIIKEETRLSLNNIKANC